MEDETIILPGGAPKHVRNVLPDPDEQARIEEAMFWDLYEDVPASMRDLITRATTEPRARERLVEEFRTRDAESKERVRRLHQHHLQQRTVTAVRQINGRLIALETEHNAIMAGEKTGCRHLEQIKSGFWKFLALSLGIPLLLLVIAAILSLAYFRGQTP